MRKVQTLPWTVEEGKNKIVTALSKADVEYYTEGREVYINEDLLLNEDLEVNDKSFIKKIKNYLRNEIQTKYVILSFDIAPKGSYMMIECTNNITFSKLAKIFNLKSEDEMIEVEYFPEIKDAKLERELEVINREIFDKGIESHNEEDNEDEYDYINFGERNCKVCGSVVRRITVHAKDGKLRDGYKCVNTNCLKIYIIR